MPKMHTRVKRMMGFTTPGKHSRIYRKKRGARTFSTSDKAKEYAISILKLPEDKFSIATAKRNKRFKIIKI